MASPERVRESGLGQNNVDRTPTDTRQALRCATESSRHIGPHVCATAGGIAFPVPRCPCHHLLPAQAVAFSAMLEVTVADARSQLMQARLRGRSCCGLVLVRVRCEPVRGFPAFPVPVRAGCLQQPPARGSPAPRIRPRSLSEWSGHPRPLPPDDVATAHLPIMAAT